MKSEGGGNSGEIEWETRPGGLLVQKRSTSVAQPPIVVRVTYGGARLHVSISSQATFGELKKLLSIETGLQPGDQRLFYKGKEHRNGDYLDLCGVKNRSKMTLDEDPASLERRYIEMQKNVRSQCMQKAVSDVSLDVDKLAYQVIVIEDSILNANKVADVQITTLIELFMRQAVKLDGIPSEGAALSQKIMQAKRIQKCVETLDMLKASNARADGVILTNAKQNHVLVTTKWETFETPGTTNSEFF